MKEKAREAHILLAFWAPDLTEILIEPMENGGKGARSVPFLAFWAPDLAENLTKPLGNEGKGARSTPFLVSPWNKEK